LNLEIDPKFVFMEPITLLQVEEELDVESDDSLAKLLTLSEYSEREEEELMNSKIKQAASSISSSVRKRRCISVYETAAEMTADGMISLGTSIKDAQLLPPQTRFDQAIEVLNEMKKDGSISSQAYFAIVKAFNEQGKEHYSAFFVGMTADLRIE
jgi:hypothetical protein